METPLEPWSKLPIRVLDKGIFIKGLPGFADGVWTMARLRSIDVQLHQDSGLLRSLHYLQGLGRLDS